MADKKKDEGKKEEATKTVAYKFEGKTYQVPAPPEDYETPEWLDDDGNFLKVNKEEFGFSLKGKLDFIDHQLAMYADRKKAMLIEVEAKNDPVRRLELQLAAKRKKIAEAEKELEKLKKARASKK